jgi:hypothetical protein
MRRVRVSRELQALPEGVDADAYDRNLEDGWPFADSDESGIGVPAARAVRPRRRRRRKVRERPVSDVGGG